jgi:hypothetical protein
MPSFPTAQIAVWARSPIKFPHLASITSNPFSFTHVKLEAVLVTVTVSAAPISVGAGAFASSQRFRSGAHGLAPRAGIDSCSRGLYSGSQPISTAGRRRQAVSAIGLPTTRARSVEAGCVRPIPVGGPRLSGKSAKNFADMK